MRPAPQHDALAIGCMVALTAIVIILLLLGVLP